MGTPLNAFAIRAALTARRFGQRLQGPGEVQGAQNRRRVVRVQGDHRIARQNRLKSVLEVEP